MQVNMTVSATELDDSTAEIERSVASIWQEVLNTSNPPGPSDDFFSLGGDSMAMIMVELRIREELSIDIPDGSILGASSLRELARLIAERR
jgi:acyl carrier protein